MTNCTGQDAGSSENSWGCLDLRQTHTVSLDKLEFHETCIKFLAWQAPDKNDCNTTVHGEPTSGQLIMSHKQAETFPEHCVMNCMFKHTATAVVVSKHGDHPTGGEGSISRTDETEPAHEQKVPTQDTRKTT